LLLNLTATALTPQVIVAVFQGYLPDYHAGRCSGQRNKGHSHPTPGLSPQTSTNSDLEDDPPPDNPGRRKAEEEDLAVYDRFPRSNEIISPERLAARARKGTAVVSAILGDFDGRRQFIVVRQPEWGNAERLNRGTHMQPKSIGVLEERRLNRCVAPSEISLSEPGTTYKQ
jgi:hypothetical protein